MSGSHFSHKHIDLMFELGKGAFGESGTDTVSIQGLRCSASIDFAGGAAMSFMHLRVYGMTPSQVNQLSSYGDKAFAERNNVVTLSAGDDATGSSVVFRGTMQEAIADYAGMPDVVFTVYALTAHKIALKPAPPTSYRGGVDVAVIMQGIASHLGLQFENSGVNGIILSNPYLPGTLKDQMDSAARAANIEAHIINDRVLAIWPKLQARGDQVPLVSPGTGMIGYPAFNSMGIIVTTVFNPSINFGNAIQVESSLKPACGRWICNKLQHELESEMPNGNWFSRIQAVKPGFVEGISTPNS